MSSPTHNMPQKQPIKRLEIQINNFNVAIPHHVNLLKRHKNEIKKFQERGDWEYVRKQHISVSRIIKQLQELLYQMDMLRHQVIERDLNEFDKVTCNAKKQIMEAIDDYLNLQIDMPSQKIPVASENTESNTFDNYNQYIQLEQDKEDLQHQEQCLQAWNDLQNDIHDLHQLFIDLNKIVYEQKELVNTVENNIEITEVNVTAGENFLKQASKYKALAYPLTGAIVGTCISGPIGLIAGLKIGGFAALSGGILGFTGGSFLRKKQIESENQLMGNKQDETIETACEVVENHQKSL